MALMEVKTYPDPVLRKETEPIETFDEDLEKLVQDMAETMYANDGVGLAAPQVGLSKKLVILDVGESEDRGRQLLVLANPKVVEGDGKITWEEGCLSLPGMQVKVQRKAQVMVKAQNIHGEDMEVKGEELLAVALQHEIDHLKGKLIIDYASPLKKRMLLKDYKKQTAEEQS